VRRALKALRKLRNLRLERLEFSIRSRTTLTGRPRKREKKKRESKGRKIEKSYWATVKHPMVSLSNKTSSTKQ
jgi:hypothetical protein